MKNSHCLDIDNCTIYFDPIDLNNRGYIPKKWISSYLSLLEKSQSNPKGCLEEILQLKTHCPKSPEIDNLHIYLLLQHKHLAKAEQLIAQTYEKYPNYFFAKINYADQLLRKKQYDQVSKLFPFDEIEKNFSNQTKYHVSEYRSFMLLKSQYYLAIKKKDLALTFFHKAYQADPAHLAVIALEKKLLKKNLLKRLFSLFRQ